ncbi:MAG: AAA family ATPase [Roseburia inulinivorans]
MGRFVNPDNSAFQVALNSKIYVDKTGLIEYTNSVLDTTDAYICNSRPRRFGKSYAANMLATYYSKGADSEKMFSGLQISKEADFREHLNKYDVIHIDIQWFLANCEDVDNVVTLITDSVLSELREIYPDIFTWEVSRLPDALSIVREKPDKSLLSLLMNGMF